MTTPPNAPIDPQPSEPQVAPQYAAPVLPAAPKGLAISALVVGIVGFLMGLLPIIGAIVGIAAVVLGAISLSKKQPKGFALTGLILGAVAAIASIGMTLGLGALGNEVARVAEESSVTAPAPETTEEEATPEVAEEPASDLTVSQENAVRKAESYLAVTPFSRSGLIKQLEFEQFSTADAEFAVDYISPDWNEQAAKKAKDYLEVTAFSRDGLITQLEFEGFTPEQAAFGATAVGL